MSAFDSLVTNYLRPAQNTTFGKSVEYRRTGITSATVTARTGRLADNTLALEAISIEVDSKDFLISVASLSAFGEPLKGDIIAQTINGVAHLFKVMSEGKQPCFSYMDDDRKYFRIRTKLTGKEGS